MGKDPVWHVGIELVAADELGDYLEAQGYALATFRARPRPPRGVGMALPDGAGLGDGLMRAARAGELARELGERIRGRLGEIGLRLEEEGGEVSIIEEMARPDGGGGALAQALWAGWGPGRLPTGEQAREMLWRVGEIAREGARELGWSPAAVTAFGFGDVEALCGEGEMNMEKEEAKLRALEEARELEGSAGPGVLGKGRAGL